MAAKPDVLLTVYFIDFLGTRVLGNQWEAFKKALATGLAAKAEQVTANDLWGPTHRYTDVAEAVRCCHGATDSAKTSVRWSDGHGPVPVQYLLHTADAECAVGAEPKVWVFFRPGEVYVTKKAWEKWRQVGLAADESTYRIHDELLSAYRLSVPEQSAAQPVLNLFPRRRLPLHGSGTECFYCGMDGHHPQQCASRHLLPEARGLPYAGKLSLHNLDRAYREVFQDRESIPRLLSAETGHVDLRNNTALQICTAFLDLRRIYQLRFLGLMFLANAETWSDILYVRGSLGDSPTTFYRGYRALIAKDYADAEKYFSDVKGADQSTKFYSQVGLAFISLERGQIQKTEFHLTKAGKITTVEAERLYLHFLMSRLYEIRGEPKSALAEMDRALEERRHADDTRYRREQLAAQLGKTDGCAQRLQVIAARNKEAAVALILDPWMESIRPELDRCLLTLLLSAHQVGSGKVAAVRKRGSALASWLGEKDPDVAPVVSSLHRLSGSVTNASYFEMLELDQAAEKLISSCENTRKSRVQALKKQLEGVGKQWKKIQDFWKDFPLKRMYTQLGVRVAEGQEKLQRAKELSASENVADYKEVMELLNDVQARTAELAREFRQVGAMPLILGFVRRLLAYLILFESLAVATGLVLIPLFRTILSLDRQGRAFSSHAGTSVTYTLVLAVAPVLAIVITAIKQKRAAPAP